MITHIDDDQFISNSISIVTLSRKITNSLLSKHNNEYQKYRESVIQSSDLSQINQVLMSFLIGDNYQLNIFMQ